MLGSNFSWVAKLNIFLARGDVIVGSKFGINLININVCIYIRGDVNLWELVNQESHEHWSPRNTDDSTVFIWLDFITECLESSSEGQYTSLQPEDIWWPCPFRIEPFQFPKRQSRNLCWLVRISAIHTVIPIRKQKILMYMHQCVYITEDLFILCSIFY